MRARDEAPYVWGATTAELTARYDCDALLPEAPYRLVRATSTSATPETMFLWLCQLRIAPYSYDWLDNFGRQSPRALVPGLDDLEPGMPVMTIFTLTSFTKDEELTLLLERGAARVLFGDLAISYAVRSTPVGSRLVAVLRCVGDGTIPMPLLSRGDLVMMRRQFRTLTKLAEDTLEVEARQGEDV